MPAQTTIFLDDRYLHALKLIKAGRGISMRWVMEAALREYLATNFEEQWEAALDATSARAQLEREEGD